MPAERLQQPKLPKQAQKIERQDNNIRNGMACEGASPSASAPLWMDMAVYGGNPHGPAAPAKAHGAAKKHCNDHVLSALQCRVPNNCLGGGGGGGGLPCETQTARPPWGQRRVV